MDVDKLINTLAEKARTHYDLAKNETCEELKQFTRGRNFGLLDSISIIKKLNEEDLASDKSVCLCNDHQWFLFRIIKQNSDG